MWQSHVGLLAKVPVEGVLAFRRARKHFEVYSNKVNSAINLLFFSKFFFKIYFMCIRVLPVSYICVPCSCSWIPETGVRDGCELPIVWARN